MEVSQAEVVLCEFYFSDLKQNKLRPVVVFKDNLPFEDFVGIPISSRLDSLKDDEVVIDQSDFTMGSLPKRSKVIDLDPKEVLARHGVGVRQCGQPCPRLAGSPCCCIRWLMLKRNLIVNGSPAELQACACGDAQQTCSPGADRVPSR
ncbi:MAG: type II toxin-antitoxin system PemK/MazF family toxin [Lamprobacter sp.]|uniref:hypothetical protein n=1 Tax=Lamprobacter sp. TaxID=3100796 RepID=UPI002B25FFC9|nr:hypothetical protein [Lamprobacter sp.]MEA3642367.1 type II toxin-antitoxin system PemK/MazF family toxin [Lamprobacter sp.]